MARGDIDPERRQKAIDALARGASKTNAAKLSGYSRCYLQTLLSTNPEFAAQVEARRQELATDAAPEPERERLQTKIITRLEKVLDEGQDKDVIAAAKALWNIVAPPKQKASPAAPAAEPKAKAPVLKLSPEAIRRKYS